MSFENSVYPSEEMGCFSEEAEQGILEDIEAQKCWEFRPWIDGVIFSTSYANKRARDKRARYERAMPGRVELVWQQRPAWTYVPKCRHCSREIRAGDAVVRWPINKVTIHAACEAEFAAFFV